MNDPYESAADQVGRPSGTCRGRCGKKRSQRSARRRHGSSAPDRSEALPPAVHARGPGIAGTEDSSPVPPTPEMLRRAAHPQLARPRGAHGVKIQPMQDNEQLEFSGDSILGFLVAEALVKPLSGI